jgi:hypothetical protein
MYFFLFYKRVYYVEYLNIKNNILRCDKRLQNFSNIPYAKTLIIRGIGNQIKQIVNNIEEIGIPAAHYLLVRTKQSYFSYIPLIGSINIAIKRKERKLVIYSFNKKRINDLFVLIVKIG